MPRKPAKQLPPPSPGKGVGAGKEQPKTSASAKKTSNSPAIKKEVKLLALAAGGILFLVAVFFPGAAGPVGDFVRNFLLGLFGFGAFVLPVAFLAVAILGLVSRSMRLPILLSSLLIWFVLALLHTISHIVNPFLDPGLGIFGFLGEVYLEGRIVGGGIVGAILGQTLRFFLRDVGAIIVISAAIIIFLVLITGRSFVNFVEKGVGAARTYYDERAARRLLEAEEEEDVPIENAPKKGKMIKMPREKRPMPRHRHDDEDENEYALLDMEDTTGAEDSPKILLIQEEFEESKSKRAAAHPLFARRDEKPKQVEKRGAVLTFPENFVQDPDEAGEEYVENYYEDEDVEEYVAGYHADFVDDEPDDDDIPYEDEIPPDEPVVTNAAAQKPVEADSPKDASAPIVKGLVNNDTPTKSEPEPPRQIGNLFDDSNEDDLLEFDEFAQASKAPAAKPPEINPTPELPNYENYELPSLDLLAVNERLGTGAESRAQVLENSRILEETLKSFRVEARVVEVSVGPTVTRYDLAPGPGVKVSSIANLTNDLALSLAAQGIRIEAPIPGKSAVGIEIPNKEPQSVFLREIIEDDKFKNFPSKLAFAVGKDIAGGPVVTDVARMPHLLIAGATGSGKSVCINTLIASLLYKARPDEVKLLMIDPKVVELSVYNGIPHLLIPVVTDPKKASGALSWAVAEMESRYNMFAESGVRDLKGYNKVLAEEEAPELPQIVIIIDELADLMMVCKGEVEESICRLAQKARAAGIHLIVATQRPSVDVITGLIKANIPSRLAFAVSSGTDSRTVLDMYGAEKLLGKGDMLFLPIGQNKPIRVQGGYISDKEVETLVSFLKAQAPVEHTTDMIQKVTMPGKTVPEGEVDEFFHDSVEFLLAKGKASTSMLQRQFRIGYNRASRLMDNLEASGIVGPEDGVKPRKVTITREEYKELYGK